MSGAFEARESFTIASLSERFQTSHMPVREALRRLASESALQISSTGTAFVPGITRIELEDITRARALIEGAAARLAAAHLTPADIAQLEALLAEHRDSSRKGDVKAMTSFNREFHFLIYRAAQSPVLLSQIENLWLRSGPYVRFLSQQMREIIQTEHKSGFTDFHQVAIDAARAKDHEGFGRAIEDDIRHSSAFLLDVLQDEAGQP